MKYRRIVQTDYDIYTDYDMYNQIHVQRSVKFLWWETWETIARFPYSTRDWDEALILIERLMKEDEQVDDRTRRDS